MILENLVSFTGSGFRSIAEPLTIPLDKRITFLVGQNNAGKSSVMKMLANVMNSSSVGLDPLDRPVGKEGPTFKGAYNLNIDLLKILFDKMAQNNPTDHKPSQSALLLEFISKNRCATLKFEEWSDRTLEFKHHKLCIMSECPDVDITTDVNAELSLEKIGPMFNELALNSKVSNLVEPLFNSGYLPFTDGILDAHCDLPGVYNIPSQRFILDDTQAKKLPQFAAQDWNVNGVNLAEVAKEYAKMDRANGSEQDKTFQEEKLKQIEAFLAHCIEASSVEITLPRDLKTIDVRIDGKRQPLSNLGSGIEQLLIIGYASFAFDDKIVLIDEPELHFHPRTQKLMVQYLNTHSKAKFVMATHSAAILDAVDNANIVHIEQYNEGDKKFCRGFSVQSNAERFKAVQNLGYTPSALALANFVIWVEGPSDRVYIDFWLQKLANKPGRINKLIEGVDYTFLFYGGSILKHHSFDDDNRALVNALTVGRRFAVYFDRDRVSDAQPLKDAVNKAIAQIKPNEECMYWVSDGLEIENYIPESIFIACLSAGAKSGISFEKNSKISDKTGKKSKVDFAHLVVAQWNDLPSEKWPLDLKEKVGQLLSLIEAAR